MFSPSCKTHPDSSHSGPEGIRRSVISRSSGLGARCYTTTLASIFLLRRYHVDLGGFSSRLCLGWDMEGGADSRRGEGRLDRSALYSVVNTTSTLGWAVGGRKLARRMAG
ncbi:hypothetical protein H310_06234 [Aphanomyces invadans]|uniref:Uncharacterized protein n=1 Tax=Aphanomyces invadans TaxID=157072 RepID=A0A024U5P6_9STRA|nr:hypothetical protein H310_06234 [Aphanomyces invadans]ETW01594.1 hypothetical protein H310_06234 [Aphanomyces invadans]|eukprot:XP_008869442.1 hypothetical protein H310_06234 [Aphanomyces invadans]